MTVALLPSLATAITPTVTIGGATGRSHHPLSASMVITIAADRHFKASAVAIAAPITSPVADISPRMAPATPTATVKSP
jgi:hypothetical protein